LEPHLFDPISAGVQCVQSFGPLDNCLQSHSKLRHSHSIHTSTKLFVVRSPLLPPPFSSSSSSFVCDSTFIIFAVDVLILFQQSNTPRNRLRMRTISHLLVRAFGDALGMPTYLTIVVLIVVPVLVIGSSALLIFYWVKARQRRRRASHNRGISKSSYNSMEGEQELGLTGASYHPGTSGSQRSRFVGANEKDRRVVAGHVKGAGSEVFDVDQWESERASQRKRDMVLPSPPASPIFRPVTRDDHSHPQALYPPVNQPIDLDHDFNQPEFRASELSFLNLSKSSGRYVPLELPPPIHQPNRPSHSPVRHTPSPRSLSIFPPKHIFHNSTPQSPSTYASSEAPTLLTPLSPHPSPKLPPVPRARMHRHVRHPSIDRNSNMPIAPILISNIVTPSRSVLPTLNERGTPDYNEDYYSGDLNNWVDRDTRNYAYR
jgi:hypothetical protein